MGGSSLAKKVDDINLLPNFKQVYEESLKMLGLGLIKMNNESSNTYGKEKLHLYFYYGLAPWYKNALDFASGGSFVLTSPKENSTIIKNLFGDKEENEELENMSNILDYLKKKLRIVLKGYLIKVIWIT
jgi:hypothetical protein